ncbi:MAG: zinc-finger domain-containing protein [Alphaproteobacteria bacterium]|nr:zinc-finger domain-containing protein [Alphaproteobacteria bacterium]
MAEAAKSIPPSEIIAVKGHRIACDGGGGALGHPRVFLEMGEADFVECPYCDRRYVRSGSPEDPNA